MAKDEVINDGINNTAHVGMPKRSRIALAQHADPDTVLISTNKKTIQVSVQEELGKTGADSMQADESTHHQIYYLRQRISERTPSLDRLKPVELPKALEDTLNLGIADPTYKSPEYAVVVFYNQQTLEVTALVCEARYASSDHNAASVIWFMKLYFCPGRTPGLRGGSRGFALRHGGMARVSGSNHAAEPKRHATRGCFLYNYAAATAHACSFSGIGIDFVLPPR